MRLWMHRSRWLLQWCLNIQKSKILPTNFAERRQALASCWQGKPMTRGTVGTRELPLQRLMAASYFNKLFKLKPIIFLCLKQLTFSQHISINDPPEPGAAPCSWAVPGASHWWLAALGLLRWLPAAMPGMSCSWPRGRSAGELKLLAKSGDSSESCFPTCSPKAAAVVTAVVTTSGV